MKTDNEAVITSLTVADRGIFPTPTSAGWIQQKRKVDTGGPKHVTCIINIGSISAKYVANSVEIIPWVLSD